MKIIYKENFSTETAAVKREKEIKGWSKKKKLDILNNAYSTVFFEAPLLWTESGLLCEEYRNINLNFRAVFFYKVVNVF